MREIRNCDARELDFIDDGSIDLIITSPPYNVSVDYDSYDDDLDRGEYRKFIADVFNEGERVLKDCGRFCVVVSLKNDGEVVDNPSVIKNVAREMGWNLRFEIVWSKGESESSTAWGSWRSPSSPRPIFNHEYIYIFDVGESKKDYRKSIPKKRFMDLVKSVWDVSTGHVPEHPATFPVEIPERLIELNSYQGDVVLDPMVGSGNTVIAAENLDRAWVGTDISEKYIDLSYRRLEEETGFSRSSGLFDH